MAKYVKTEQGYVDALIFAPAQFKPEGKSYLTFSSPKNFTLKVNNKTKNWDGILEYFSSDKTWTTWNGTTILSAYNNDGEYVLYLRGTGNTKITGNGINKEWIITGTDVKCIGNIENLLDYGIVESGGHPTMASYCYNNMFYGCTALTQAPALPATTLADYCYQLMFYGCTALTQAPDLPATTLANNCYGGMFLGCSSLTQAPVLPATTLAINCYGGMFLGCTSLTKAPALPLKTLISGCYSSMFYGCTSLTKAPALPATTLADYCYSSMFRGCTALTQAPALPATTLANNCYSSMFYGCTSLTQAPELPATTLANNCYESMFYGCRSIKLSSTQTGEYTQEYIVGYTSNYAYLMFYGTGGTFTGTPEINTTYYLSTDNMIVRDTEVATLNGYVGSMIDVASIQPDWNQNDETAPDYVKNRPFYTGDPVETVLVEERTVEFAAADGMYMAEFQSTFAATVGETYKVYWDGAAYECTCVDFQHQPAIGNLSIVGAGSDTGEPFIMAISNGEGIAIGTADTSASHTFSISEFAQEVVKIDAKYLPDTVATKSEVEDVWSKANAAQSTANAAQSTANAAQSTANAAQSTAETAQSTAANAQSTAETAQSTAANAQSTAETAQSTAANAQSTANAAQSTANAAQSTAANAQSTANDAKAEVAKALTVDSSGRINAPIDAMDDGAYQSLNLSSKDQYHDASFKVSESVGLQIWVARDGGLQSDISNSSTVQFIANGAKRMRLKGIDELIMNSSIPNSTKKFKITVDDNSSLTITNEQEGTSSICATPSDISTAVSDHDSNASAHSELFKSWKRLRNPNNADIADALAATYKNGIGDVLVEVKDDTTFALEDIKLFFRPASFKLISANESNYEGIYITMDGTQGRYVAKTFADSEIMTPDGPSTISTPSELALYPAASDAVLYTPQTLTEAQQKQARANIGAGQPVFVVNVTGTGNDNYTADKTAAEIEAAYQAGRTIVCKTQMLFMNSYISIELPLMSRMQERVFVFAVYQLMMGLAIVAITVNISDSKVEVSTTSMDDIYEKPVGGIPKSDLADDVQTSLDKADTAISLGLTTATPGQIIKVKTVQDGKPTEWEAVDMPSGDKWEKIKEITIAEGAEESNALTINADENGNTFRLKKARLCAKFPAYTGTSTIPNYSFAMINGKTAGRIAPLLYTSVWPKISTKQITGTIYYVDVSGAQQIEHAQVSGNGGWSDDTTRDYRIYGTVSDQLRSVSGDTLWAKPITSIGGAGMLIYPGCHFVLYGVRE